MIFSCVLWSPSSLVVIWFRLWLSKTQLNFLLTTKILIWDIQCCYPSTISERRLDCITWFPTKSRCIIRLDCMLRKWHTHVLATMPAWSQENEVNSIRDTGTTINCTPQNALLSPDSASSHQWFLLSYAFYIISDLCFSAKYIRERSLNAVSLKEVFQHSPRLDFAQCGNMQHSDLDCSYYRYCFSPTLVY